MWCVVCATPDKTQTPQFGSPCLVCAILSFRKLTRAWWLVDFRLGCLKGGRGRCRCAWKWESELFSHCNYSSLFFWKEFEFDCVVGGLGRKQSINQSIMPIRSNWSLSREGMLAIRYDTIQHHTTQHNTTRRAAMRCDAMRHAAPVHPFPARSLN